MAKGNNGIPHSTSTNAVKPRLQVQRANRFILDDTYYWHCVIVAITPQPAPDATRSPRYRWTLEGPGTVRPWQLHFSTPMELGEAIEEEEIDNNGDTDVPEMTATEVALPRSNALAQICLTLSLVNEDDLQPHNLDATIDRLDLAAALGLTVKCQVAKRNTAFINGAMRPCNPYYTPKMDTFSLDN